MTTSLWTMFGQTTIPNTTMIPLNLIDLKIQNISHKQPLNHVLYLQITLLAGTPPTTWSPIFPSMQFPVSVTLRRPVRLGKLQPLPVHTTGNYSCLSNPSTIHKAIALQPPYIRQYYEQIEFKFCTSTYCDYWLIKLSAGLQIVTCFSAHFGLTNYFWFSIICLSSPLPPHVRFFVLNFLKSAVCMRYRASQEKGGILDVADGWHDLCRMIGSSYSNQSIRSPNQFNPMQSKRRKRRRSIPVRVKATLRTDGVVYNFITNNRPEIKEIMTNERTRLHCYLKGWNEKSLTTTARTRMMITMKRAGQGQYE